MTASYLRNAAMHYLSGRAASTSMLRQTLTRRAKRRLDVRTLDEPTAALIDKAIADLVALGMIDDTRFAENRAASLQRKGLSIKRIGLGLKLKGIDTRTAARAMAPDLDDLAQARLFAERKKLGPWRGGGPDETKRQKELQALSTVRAIPEIGFEIAGSAGFEAAARETTQWFCKHFTRHASSTTKR